MGLIDRTIIRCCRASLGRLYWSDGHNRFDPADESERRLLYQIVLAEGSADDVRDFLHLPTLLRIWDQLWLSAAVHDACGPVGRCASHRRCLTSSVELRPLSWHFLRQPNSLSAGGAALIFFEVIDRDTRDLDCFGPSSESVDELAPAAASALRDVGYEVDVDQLRPGFGRLRVSADGEETLLDLGFDPADLPPTSTELGAVRALPDLAGDKLLALFSRAAPRDFVDVAGLLRWFTHDEMMALASGEGSRFRPAGPRRGIGRAAHDPAR